MRITIRSIGRIKSGPERDLIDEYSKRFNRIRQGIGLQELTEIELASGGGQSGEGARLLSKLPARSRIIRLDEHGRACTSIAFARELAHRRDEGTANMVFLIGGASGYAPEVIRDVPDTIAFGTQTWPHRLARVMLAEQLYRAASILAGTPYHKA